MKRGDRVAMLLPRTSRLIFTMFGIMKAGAAYIPCDPHYPADRIKLILEDSEAAYIVTDDENLENLKAQAGEGSLKVLEKALNVEELLQCENTANPAIPQEGGDLAYIIYTSGSTGRPKGVMLHHKGICNELFAHLRFYRSSKRCDASPQGYLQRALCPSAQLPQLDGDARGKVHTRTGHHLLRRFR